MAASPKRRTSISPSATTPILVSKPITTSSSSTRHAETTSSRSHIVPELIPLVASRLTSLRDFFALRAACRTYRALLPPSPSNFASQAPLPLFPHKASASKALLRRLLRFLTRREPSLTSFYAFGCHVAIHDFNSSNSRGQLHISHNLTGERVRLPDPQKYFNAVMFSGDLVITFHRGQDVLYYCRIGDAQWQHALCDEGYRWCDLVFVKDTLYALIGPNCRLATVELYNNSVKLSFLGDESSAQTLPDSSLFWLAECRGEPLLVITVRYNPLGYHVFRWQSEERKWVRTTSLGGCTLFFNRRQFAGCLGPDHPGVRRDSMYFAWCSGKWWGEYSLVDGYWHDRFADYTERAVKENSLPLAWVLPSIG